MRGKVIKFNQEKSYGFILGEDGLSYFFHTSNVNLPFEVHKNKMLSFRPSINQKGLCAENIIIDKTQQPKNNYCNKSQKKYVQPQVKKKRFVTIGNITVNLNDVKSAQVKGNKDKAKLLIRTYSSGILVEYYHYEMSVWNAARQQYVSLRADFQAKKDLDKLLSQL